MVIVSDDDVVSAFLDAPAPLECPTEPMPNPLAGPTRRPPPEAPLPSAFAHTRFQFTSGVPAGEKATIRDRAGTVLFTYRSFASVVSIVATLVASVVLLAGAAGVLFLLMEGRLFPALLAMMMSGVFAVVIILLIPPSRVTLYDGPQPALTIAQLTKFSLPNVTWTVSTPDGQLVGRIRRSFFSRLGRDRWIVMGPSDAGPTGTALEESLIDALQRKLAGKFHPRYQSNLGIRYAGSNAGTIQRRPSAHGAADVLDLAPNCPLDPRVAVALATLVLGSEP